MMTSVTRSMTVDPCGRVIRSQHPKKMQPSFTSRASDGGRFFCSPNHIRHPSPSKKKKKTIDTKNAISLLSPPIIRSRHLQPSSSIESPIDSREQNQKPSSGLSESSGASPHQTSVSIEQNGSKSISKISQGPLHTLSLGDEEENQTSPLSSRKRLRRQRTPFSKRLSHEDSHITATTRTSSLGTHASMMLDKYAFMSYRFPITQTTEKVVMRRLKNRDIVIETSSSGETIGFIHHCNSLKEQAGSIRILKDVTGRPCAIIQQKRSESYGCPTTIFRIYGDKPCTYGQEPTTKDKAVSGCYLWAEIKNTGSMSGRFVMKRYSSETGPGSSHQNHCAKRFGSLFSFKQKSKGFVVLDSEEKDCVKMVSLNNSNNQAKGIVIAPSRDMCLMLAFCAVVDEMVEQRLR